MADAALINAISSAKVLKEVYHLKGAEPSDYLKSISNLIKASVPVCPHIIAGLENGKIKSEKEIIKKLSELGVKHFVFAALKKISKDLDFTASIFRPEAFIDLIAYTAKINPASIRSIGCARPPFLRNAAIELEMIKAGANILSFPAEETLKFYSENHLEHAFIQTCCAYI